MRLATFNMLHGRSLADGRFDEARLAAAIAGLDVDVLGAAGGRPRTVAQRAPGPDGAGGGRAGREASPVRGAVVGTPGEAFRASLHDEDGVDEPNYGIGLVSRYPVRSWRVTRLRSAPVRSPVYVAGPGGGLILLRDEPRVLLAAILDTPYGAGDGGGDAPVVRAGLERAPAAFLGARAADAAGAADPVGRPEPARPGGRAGVAVADVGRLPTYPSPHPKVQLDHVLADPRGGGALPPVTEVSTPETTVSDHRPLVVQLG